VLPAGQPVVGALMLPPLTVQDEAQLLLVTCTSPGAVVSDGQASSVSKQPVKIKSSIRQFAVPAEALPVPL
jgi:hypothetical protein